jgi:yecA family protein
MSYSLDYTSLEQALDRADAAMGPAECHGVLCGLLCGQGAIKPETWLREVFDAAVASTAAVEDALELLRVLYTETVEQLYDVDFGLRLFLPDDEVGVGERARALGQWCQGFLLGFSAGGHEESRLPEGVREVLADFVEITRVEAESDEDDEQQEQSYAEIVEYVRAGVLLTFDELHPEGGAPTLQ